MKTVMLFAATLVISTPVLAQKMYRCGNKFQDRPCAAAPANSAAPEQTSAAPVVERAPVMTKAQRQQQIRCENYSRQLGALEKRQAAAPQQAKAMGVQIESLQSRMKADRCS